MLTEELVAAGDLAADGLAAVTHHMRATHGGIAERVFSSIGAAAEPVRLIHDGIADAVYTTLARASAGALRAGARAAAYARVADVEPTPLDASPRGRFALGAINGAFGDAIAGRGNGLAIEMSVRVRGRAVPPRRDSLAQAFPAPTRRLAVFIHGLCETEDAWRRRADRQPT